MRATTEGQRLASHNGRDAPAGRYTVPVASPTDPFARLRLTGPRFSEGSVPVETLVELAAYQELVVGVARELFRERHPDRQRIPRGFAEGLQLRLRTVEQGSAMPVLERTYETLPLLASPDEFTAARDLIEEAVAAIAEGQQLPEGFPRRALVLFNRFGQTLRGDEGIEMRRGTALSGPMYTRAVRRALILRQKQTYQDDISDIGWISEIDAGHMRCLVRLQSGPSAPVPAPLDEVTFAPVRDAMEPNGEGAAVRISGTGVFDVDGRLLRFDSIHEVSTLDDGDNGPTLDQRLDELSRLPEGWLDGEGVPPNTSVVERARTVLRNLQKLDVPRPRVFATPRGGMQAEWTVGSHEISVTFEPDGSLYAISVNAASGQTDEPQLMADRPEQIAQFVLHAS